MVAGRGASRWGVVAGYCCALVAGSTSWGPLCRTEFISVETSRGCSPGEGIAASSCVTWS